MPDLTEPVTLEMPKSACLLLFEMLTTAYELWRKANPDDASANPMVIAAQTHAERVALWKLEGVLERTLPELPAPAALSVDARKRHCSPEMQLPFLEENVKRQIF